MGPGESDYPWNSYMEKNIYLHFTTYCCSQTWTDTHMDRPCWKHGLHGGESNSITVNEETRIVFVHFLYFCSNSVPCHFHSGFATVENSVYLFSISSFSIRDSAACAYANVRIRMYLSLVLIHSVPQTAPHSKYHSLKTLLFMFLIHSVSRTALHRSIQIAQMPSSLHRSEITMYIC